VVVGIRRYRVPLPACLRASGRMRRAFERMGCDNLGGIRIAVCWCRTEEGSCGYYVPYHQAYPPESPRPEVVG